MVRILHIHPHSLPIHISFKLPRIVKKQVGVSEVDWLSSYTEYVDTNLKHLIQKMVRTCCEYISFQFKTTFWKQMIVNLQTQQERKDVKCSRYEWGLWERKGDAFVKQERERENLTARGVGWGYAPCRIVRMTFSTFSLSFEERVCACVSARVARGSSLRSRPALLLVIG